MILQKTPKSKKVQRAMQDESVKEHRVQIIRPDDAVFGRITARPGVPLFIEILEDSTSTEAHAR